MAHGDIIKVNDQLQQSVDHITAILEANRMLLRENAFMTRILTQAVMTHNGMLQVDPRHAAEAMSGKHRLEYNSKGVTIYASEHSLWPNPKG
jgi:hypothetical protein